MAEPRFLGQDAPATIHDVASLLESSDIKVKTHPLGFLQSNFSRGHLQYRLNFWGTRYGRPKLPDWPVHNHRFNFRSSVLFGTLVDTRYKVDEHPLGAFEAFSVKYSNGQSALVRTGRRLSCVPIATFTYQAGQSYETAQESFHSTTNTSGLAISLMQVEKLSDDMPTVIGPMNYNGPLPDYVADDISPTKLLADLREQGAL